VVINGKFYPVHVSRNTPDALYYRGRYYETKEELWIAKLLRKMKIPFVHHATFEVRIPGCKNPRLWRPDFLFGKPYVWQDYYKPDTVIFGIEVKRTKIKGKPQTLSDALKEQHGIRIIVISREILLPWFEAGVLPLEDIEAYDPLAS
jgi:hypothetical protein